MSNHTDHLFDTRRAALKNCTPEQCMDAIHWLGEQIEPERLWESPHYLHLHRIITAVAKDLTDPAVFRTMDATSAFTMLFNLVNGVYSLAYKEGHRLGSMPAFVVAEEERSEP